MLAAAGGLPRVDRQEVTVEVEPGPTGSTLRARAIRPARALSARASLAAAPTALGQPIGPLDAPASPFVVLLCRFADTPGPLPSRGEIARMYAPTYPAARHFFAEQAFGADVLAGTTVADAWVTIRDRREYVPSPEVFDYFAAGNDCATAAENAGVDLRPYYGINFQFSGPLSIRSTTPFDPLSLGGSIYHVSPGGSGRSYGATWLSSIHLGNYVVVEHEMGHAFGWQHSE